MHAGDEQLSDEEADEPEMFFFGRFHARPGEEQAIAEALLDVLAPSRGTGLPKHSRVSVDS